MLEITYRITVIGDERMHKCVMFEAPNNTKEIKNYLLQFEIGTETDHTGEIVPGQPLPGITMQVLSIRKLQSNVEQALCPICSIESDSIGKLCRECEKEEKPSILESKYKKYEFDSEAPEVESTEHDEQISKSQYDSEAAKGYMDELMMDGGSEMPDIYKGSEQNSHYSPRSPLSETDNDEQNIYHDEQNDF